MNIIDEVIDENEIIFGIHKAYREAISNQLNEFLRILNAIKNDYVNHREWTWDDDWQVYLDKLIQTIGEIK